jgi:hypothetical protein
MKDEDFKVLHSQESYGTHGSFGLKILVASYPEVDLDQAAIRNAAYKAAELIESEVGAARIAINQEAQEGAKTEREKLIGLFDGAIFVEEIQNGYCNRWCCRHLPWFVVTTRIGRITIGWRKRVISIDWKGSLVTQTAGELFPGEDVTKAGQSIHAWGYEKAKQYLDSILNAEPQETVIV